MCKDAGDEGGGQVIHCLMHLASKGELSSGRGCEQELKVLLREANPMESTNWRLDPVLQRTCQVISIQAYGSIRCLDMTNRI